ncbi:MAG: CDP-alcohol phosphatidyltransferase family protein [Acidobacteria bacterium]|nr:CDP-alcohol phosphatidyltransferase family protein [Acidobacteriota bacterium]
MRMTVANQLTIARMAIIPLLITLVLSNHAKWALLVFILAGLSDMLDGVIARRYRQKSSLGTFLDPMADKLLMTACFIVLSIPDHPQSFPDYAVPNHIPIYLTIVTISRDVFIIMVALVIHLASGLSRFPPTVLGKTTTVIQVLMIGFVLLFNALGQEAPVFIQGLGWLTLAATIASGFHYIRNVARVIAQSESGAPASGDDP